MDNRAQIREFLASRRARITPEQAGLPAYGGNRRVSGLRREEVAMLAGVSIDYYVRMERGNLAGASDSVLEGIARALQLDDAERGHLFDLARASEPRPARLRRSREPGVTASVQQVLDAITEAPAWVRNARHDMLAANRMARALYAPLLAGPRRPANNARFVYLDPASRAFFTDWDRAADDIAAMLRSEAGRNPYDRKLIELIGELSTRSEDFRTRWAAHNVRFHRTGHKKLHHPVVGDLDLNFEAMELPSQPGLTLLVYTAPQHSPTADGLTLLASWAATAERTGELADYGQHRNGSRNHDELFPDRISTLAQTDPEFIERFDNFAFDEVLADSDLDTRTRLMVQVFDFLHAANDVLAERGVQLPLPGQSTTTPAARLERGLAVQKQIVGGDRVDAMYHAAPDDEQHLVKGHVANLNVGNDRARLLIVLTVLIPFIGYPRTLNALGVLDEVAPADRNERAGS